MVTPEERTRDKDPTEGDERKAAGMAISNRRSGLDHRNIGKKDGRSGEI